MRLTLIQSVRSARSRGTLHTITNKQTNKQQSLKSVIFSRNFSSLVFQEGDRTFCIVRSRRGDHINQALYVIEDLRVLNDVITLILRIETKKISIVSFIFFLVSVRDGIVSGIYKVFFHRFLVVKWHSFPYNYAFGNDTCSAMIAICLTGCNRRCLVTRFYHAGRKIIVTVFGRFHTKLKLIRYIDLVDPIHAESRFDATLVT